MARNELHSDIENALRKELSGEVRFDRVSRVLYSTDASNYQIEPVGIVIPRSAEDVAKTINIASEYKVPVLPRGGGTSLAGQAVGHAIVIDFSKYMNNVLEVNADEKTVRVQPGIYLKQLNKILSVDGLMFGPDPSTASVATMGGVIGNNATGAHSILYGMAGDNLLSSEVILEGGDIVVLGSVSGRETARGNLYKKLQALRKKYLKTIESDFPKHWRRASGYSLNYLLEDNFNPAGLIAGAEGTLGVSTDFTLKLVDTPTEKGLVILQFDNLIESMEAVPLILEQNPSAIELIDSTLIDITRRHPAYSKMLGFANVTAAALLAVEFYGQTLDEVKKKAEGLGSYLEKRKISCEKSYALTPEAQNNIWEVRRAGLGLIMSKRDEYKPISCIEDVSVPVESISEYTGDVQDLVIRLGTSAAFYGHASAGCLHIRPMVNLKSHTGVKLMRDLTEGAFELALKYGGVMSGEHGDGLQRSYINERLFGKELYRAMKDLKGAFDPSGMFNPGKIVDSPGPDENLRYGGIKYNHPIETSLDWSSDNGLLGAVEMCNGQGLCRKLDEGIMCPSYKATRDEIDTTRARANALRAYMSGGRLEESITEDDLHEIFDLCISCKACKTECPSKVDAAKMKLEFMGLYRAKNGISIRDRFLAHIHEQSRFASVAPGVFNLLIDNPVSKTLLSSIGIHPARTLPLLSKKRFRKRSPTVTLSKNKVLFFSDTWVSFYQPDVGNAAIELLEAAGFEIIILKRTECCGRPLLSKGLIEESRKKAESTVSLLSQYVNEGIPVIGTEPSCISTFRDEYTYLLPGDKDAEMLSKSSFLVHEFLHKLEKEGKLSVNWKSSGPDVLYHGHCHERSLTGVEAALNMLTISGCSANESGAGCCGMAGSFGYEKEHYSISKSIGEDRLFPAVRAQSDESIIAVSGFSCGHQIEHFTGRKTIHIARVLANQIDTGSQ